MTLQQLEYILKIAEAGSMNKAARELYVSQPSLTSAVRALEQELGFALFSRNRRGVVLTAEGADFLPYARQVTDAYGQLTEAYGKAGERRQYFAVSTQHYSFAVKAFVAMTKDFDVAEYEFAIRETRTLDVLDDVSQGRSEIGVLYRNAFNGDALDKLMRERRLVFAPLVTCDTFAYLWKEHPLAKRRRLKLKDLSPYPCLAFEQGDNSSFYLAEEMLSVREYPRLIRCCDRATVLNLMVGLNVYTLCSGIICEELNGSDYVSVPLTDAGVDGRVTIGFVTQREHSLTPMAQRYVEELRKYLQGV